ncbi:MAG: hypothetical protein ABI895_10815 [Deltaproteobacteria bacterium]
MLAVSCFSLLSIGCSFIFVRPPPTEHEQLPYFDCVSSDAAPATDVTNAVVDGLLAIAASLDNPDTSEDERQPDFAAGVGIVGAVYAASAIYGFIMTSKCEGAKERLAARVHELRRERDALLSARTRSEPDGCRRDVDCKGERVCANAICVSPPAAPPLPAPAPALAPAPSSATP